MRGMTGVRCRETLIDFDFLENMDSDLPTVFSPLVPARGIRLPWEIPCCFDPSSALDLTFRITFTSLAVAAARTESLWPPPFPRLAHALDMHLPPLSSWEHAHSFFESRLDLTI